MSESWRASPAATASRLSGRQWTWVDHLELISDRVRHAVMTPDYRLIVECPPRHGKSELVSHWTPVWALERNPRFRVMLGSYEADFAATWGRKVRNTIEEKQEKLSVRLASDKAAANSWETTAGGGMHTAGMDGSFTGRGGDLLLIDDPFKNAKEAFSSTIRQHVWDWYASTAYTRLEPGASIIVILTRWHEDDLAGRLQKQAAEGGEPWEVIRLPAIAKVGDPLGRVPGAALWPQRYGPDRLAVIRKTLGRWFFEALFQQDPKPRGTSMFPRVCFGIVERAPANLLKVVRFWDLAATEVGANEDPDWTAGVKLGISGTGVLYVLDVRRIRGGPGEVEKLIRQTALLDGAGVPVWMEQEPGAASKHVISIYRNLVLPGFEVRGGKPSGDKATRAGPFSARAEAGEVKLVRGEWNADYLEEMEAFPAGAHDDQVDASSGAYERLTNGAAAWDREAFEQLFKGEQLSTTELLLRALRGHRKTA